MKKLTMSLVLATILGFTTSSLFAGDYAYEASKGTPLYKEFKKGDFNPYWFEQRSAYAYDRVSADTPLYKEFKEGDFNPYWFEE